MLRIGVAPCSPFSVTGELMRESAELARRHGRPPAHPPRRDDGRGRLLPGALRLLAGRVHGEPRLARRTTSGSPTPSTSTTRDRDDWAPPGPASRTARRPTPGSARASPGPATCATPASPVGLGVDGAASNEAVAPARGAAARRCCSPGPRGGPQALTVRDALEMATIGGAARARPRGRDRLARAGQARRPRAVAARHAGARRHRRPRRRARARRAAAAGAAAGQRQGRWSSATSCARVDEEALALETARRTATLVARADERPRDRGGGEAMTRRPAPGRACRPGADRTDTAATAGSATARSGRTATLKVTGEFAYASATCGWTTCSGASRCAARTRTRASSRSTSDEALATAGRGRGAHRTTTCPAQRVGLEHQPTSRCSPTTWCATRASRSRWSPPTIPRSPAGRRAKIVVDYEVLEPAVTDPACRALRPRTSPTAVHAPGGQPGAAPEDPHGRPRARPPTWSSSVDFEVGMQDQAFLGPESGLAVPGRGRRRRPVRRHPVAARRPAADLRGARAAAREGAAHPRRRRRRVRRPRGPVDARARAACSRCTPASRSRCRTTARSRSSATCTGTRRRMRYEYGAERDGRLVYVQGRDPTSTAAPTRPVDAGRGRQRGTMGIGPYVVPNVARRLLRRLHEQPAVRGDARLRLGADRFAYEAHDGPARRRARAWTRSSCACCNAMRGGRHERRPGR